MFCLPPPDMGGSSEREGAGRSMVSESPPAPAPAASPLSSPRAAVVTISRERPGV